MILCQGEELCQEGATSFPVGFVVAGFVPAGYRSSLTVRNFLLTKDFLVCIVYESIYLWEEGESGTSCSIFFLACNGSIEEGPAAWSYTYLLLWKEGSKELYLLTFVERGLLGKA